jgi:hypothetical protein
MNEGDAPHEIRFCNRAGGPVSERLRVSNAPVAHGCPRFRVVKPGVFRPFLPLSKRTYLRAAKPRAGGPASGLFGFERAAGAWVAGGRGYKRAAGAWVLKVMKCRSQRP